MGQTPNQVFSYVATASKSTDEIVTLYRSVNAVEARSASSGYFSFGSIGDNTVDVKQFWTTKEGLNKWNESRLGGQFWVEIQVPKSLIGKGKPLDTTVQVDEFFGPNAIISSRAALEQVNSSIISMKIYTNPAYYRRIANQILKEAKKQK